MSDEKSIETTLKNLNEEINHLKKELKSKSKVSELLSAALKELRSETPNIKHKTEPEFGTKALVNNEGES
ncbi:hypothetical protein [Sapientia aquatica]|uniref:Uncharacterized protein n=1 Tax=Sapientia aquatica TaxID=1549640 RepID=A0A4R5VMS7_9BURK|nr:hypothetical protein [Sapientia aquatica]TDK59278.1 hypothetical protein E2I14_18800 [Sapientia aquatica]